MRAEGALMTGPARVARPDRPVAIRQGGAVDQRRAIGWRDVWVVVKSSAERRLGKPLLMAYLFLALFGIAVVVACFVIMHL
jgi:hypothetical protein